MKLYERLAKIDKNDISNFIVTIKLWSKKNKKNIKISAFILLVVALLFRGAIQIPVIKSYEREIEKVKDNITYEEAKQSEVDYLKKIEGSDEWYEKKAREKGYIKNNEIIFYDISGQD